MRDPPRRDAVESREQKRGYNESEMEHGKPQDLVVRIVLYIKEHTKKVD